MAYAWREREWTEDGWKLCAEIAVSFIEMVRNVKIHKYLKLDNTLILCLFFIF